MKAVTAELATLINSGDFAPWDLYTIDLVGGGRLLLTTADFDVAFGGLVWSAKGPRITGDSYGHWKTGLDVDRWQVTVAPRRRDDLTGADFPDRIGSAPWLQAAARGVLDGAAVTVSRAYFGPQDRGIDIYPASDVFALEDVFAKDVVAAPLHPIPPGGAVPVGLLTLFRGTIAEVDVNTTSAAITINDSRQILTTQMPRNLYQAGCRHRLFDAGCQLNSEAYAQDRTIRADATRGYIAFAPAWTPTGSTYLTLGRMVILSGANAGFSRGIAGWDPTANAVIPINPLPFDLAAGDVVRLFPGCNKTMNTCAAYGNLVNFGGQPFIPVPETTS